MNTFDQLLAYIQTNITDAGSAYRILPATVRNIYNWLIDLTRNHTEDIAIHTTQEEKDATAEHLNNNDIHLDPADKLNWNNTVSGFTAHEQNTQIHTTQAEKDTWNGKAVIKGLESGYTFAPQGDGYNLDNVKHNADVWVNNNQTAPDKGWWFIKVRGEIGGVIINQVATHRDNGKIMTRCWNTTGSWSSWKLIAQDQNVVSAYADTKLTEAKIYTDNKLTDANAYTDNKLTEAKAYTDSEIAKIQIPVNNKMFATGLVEEVNFNGTNKVPKDVLFDDGITRRIYFFQMVTNGMYYLCEMPNNIEVVNFTATASIYLFKNLNVNNNYVATFNIITMGGSPIQLETSSTVTILSVMITIKI